MIKHFCDSCGAEITKENSVGEGGTLVGKWRSPFMKDAVEIQFEVLTATLTGSQPEFCKYCVISAVQSLDDRPRAA